MLNQYVGRVPQTQDDIPRPKKPLYEDGDNGHNAHESPLIHIGAC